MERKYDFINPEHYQKFSVETIDMMVAIWGPEKVATYCEINAFKYKMRVGDKPDQPIEQDLEKSRWYLKKAKELRSSAEKGKDPIGDKLRESIEKYWENRE